jgi:hypothetical protein
MTSKDQAPKKRGRKPKNLTPQLEINIEPLEQEPVVTEHVPKKRGRKPKPKTEIELQEPKVYKKRGRKPKPKPDVIIEKIPKKRGRKPKENYSINPVVYNKTNEEQVILHLPLKPNQLNNTEIIEHKLLRYNPKIQIPEPYEPELFAHPLGKLEGEQLNLELDDSVQTNQNININITPHMETINNDNINENFNIPMNNMNNIRNDMNDINDMNDMNDDDLIEKMNKIRENDIDVLSNKKEIPKNSYILLEFRSGNKNKQWPSKVKISCFWCSYNFDNSPYGIPIKKVGDTFHMFGNFCSSGCCAAYIFNNMSSIDKWESYSLLNMLYSDPMNPIKIAPDRICLRKFGGNLSIDEYRAITNNRNKDYNIILPPMLSIIPSMEEVSITSTNEPTFVPIDKERIKKADEILRLKRNKPLPEFKNTLENCMNLRYV